MSEVRRESNLRLPDGLDFQDLNVSYECRQKLTDSQPETLGAAARIPGMTPAAIVQLLLFTKKFQEGRSRTELSQV